METQPSSFTAPGTAARLLVVDDDAEHAEICALLLRRRGFVVAVATNGDDAVTLAGALHPDLILLDLYMPAVDGFSTAEHLHGRDETRNVPIIVLSACAEMIATRAAALGVVDWLPKPFRAADLITCVERSLSRGAPH
jgi:two-component system phosphate regulon response regulator PhoB